LVFEDEEASGHLLQLVLGLVLGFMPLLIGFINLSFKFCGQVVAEAVDFTICLLHNPSFKVIKVLASSATYGAFTVVLGYYFVNVKESVSVVCWFGLKELINSFIANAARREETLFGIYHRF